RGLAPDFRTRTLAGVPAETVTLSPTLSLTSAIVAGHLVVTTNPAGVAAVASTRGGLGTSSAYREATRGLASTEPSLVAYLDLRGLITLGERAGLTASPAAAALAPELARLGALGVSVAATPES